METRRPTWERLSCPAITGLGLICALALFACADDEPVDAGAADVGETDGDGSVDAGPSPCDLCGADEICLGGRCLAAPECGCAFGEHCVDAFCAPGCREDAQCGLGQRCEDGVCAPWCDANDDCAIYDDCVDHVCRMRCAADDECGLGEACVAGVCAEVTCRINAECGRGAACVDYECVSRTDATCEADDGCGFGWQCVDGSCVDCVSDADCPRLLVCEDMACVPPEGPGVTFELVDIGPLGEQGQVAHPDDDFFGYGDGFALLDLDGDLDLDVVLAGNRWGDAPVCAYLNTSSPGQVSWERVDAICDLGLRAEGIVAADWNRDGRDEFVAMGPSFVAWVDGFDAPVVTELLSVDDDDPCLAATGLPYDLDADGDLDLYVGCQAGADAGLDDVSARANIAFLLGDDGTWTRWTQMPEPLRNNGVSIALGVVDIDDDGLHDIVVANDTYSAPERPNYDLEPMALVRPCAPDEACLWESYRVHEGADAWGAFMGVGSLVVDGRRWVYVSDVGQNNLFEAHRAIQEDRSPEYGVAFADNGGLALVSWSSLVDDFDGDGDDDVLVTHGMFPNPDTSSHLLQVTGLALQRDDGRFQQWLGGFGTTEPAARAGTTQGFPSSTRAAMRLDVDGDGSLEYLAVHFVGYPELYRESRTPIAGGRCTVMVRDDVTLAHGWGHGVAAERQGPYRSSHVQGHLRSGDANQVFSAYRAGWVSFPSGAVVPFECPDGEHVIELAEPRWLMPITGQADAFSIDPTVLPEGRIDDIAAAVRRPDGQVEMARVLRDPELDAWRVEGATEGTDVMLRLNSRWVYRWFAR